LALTSGDVNPEEHLRLAERLLGEAEELRDRCARTGDLMACSSKGTGVYRSLSLCCRVTSCGTFQTKRGSGGYLEISD